MIAFKWWVAMYVIGTLGLFGLMYYPPAAGSALLAISLFPGLMVLTRVDHSARFLAGAIAVVLASVAEQYILSNITADKKYGFLVMAAVAASVEEMLKMFGALISENPIVTAISFAAGFATAENVGFCLRYGRTAAMHRAFFSIPMHSISGGIIGAGVGRTQEGQAFWPVCMYFVASVAMHFGFDAIAITAQWWSAMGIIAVLLAGGVVLFVETSCRTEGGQPAVEEEAVVAITM